MTVTLYVCTLLVVFGVNALLCGVRYLNGDIFQSGWEVSLNLAFVIWTVFVLHSL